MGVFMRFFLYIAFSIGVCLGVPSTIAGSITIITNNAYPVSNIPDGARIINLDRAEELHERVSLNLPKNPEQAVSTAKARLSTVIGDIQLALQDVVDAWAMGVAKIPAVVVDNKVVYGITDAQKAVGLINSYQEQKP